MSKNDERPHVEARNISDPKRGMTQVVHTLLAQTLFVPLEHDSLSKASAHYSFALIFGQRFEGLGGVFL
jgi:hypothetical protein